MKEKRPVFRLMVGSDPEHLEFSRMTSWISCGNQSSALGYHYMPYWIETTTGQFLKVPLFGRPIYDDNGDIIRVPEREIGQAPMCSVCPSQLACLTWVDQNTSGLFGRLHAFNANHVPVEPDTRYETGSGNHVFVRLKLPKEAGDFSHG